MAKKSVKRKRRYHKSIPKKKESHFRRTLGDLIIAIHPIGMPIYNLIKRKGGIKAKIGAFALIVLIFVLWLYFIGHGQQTVSNNETVTKGNNSPAAIQSITTSGNNNIVVQAAPGATVYNGISDQTFKKMYDGMVALQKQKDAELRAKFNLGYILFTATERNQIIPLNSPFDDIFTIDWKSGYEISVSADTIIMKLPSITMSNPNGKAVIQGHTMILPKHLDAIMGLSVFDYGIILKVVSLNEDSVIMALGIKYPAGEKP